MKIASPDLALFDATTDPFVNLPEVSDNFQRTLSTLVAFDRVNNLFRFVSLSNAGALRITKSIPEILEFAASSLNPLSTGTQIASRNDSRVSITLMNFGSDAIKIYYKDNTTGTTYFYLYPGQILYEDEYTGAIFGVNLGNNGDIKIIEKIARK